MPVMWPPLQVRFASFFSGGFITAIVVNPPKRRLAKRTSVHCVDLALQKVGHGGPGENMVTSSIKKGD